MPKLDSALPIESLNKTADVLTELCGISSTNDDSEGLEQIAKRLAAELSSRARA